MSLRRFAALTGCLLAVGCGSGGGGGDDHDNDAVHDDDVVDPGTISVTLEPATVTIAEGASGDVHVVATRTGALANLDISYSVANVPNGVAAELSGDVLTLRVPYFTKNQSYSLNVTAQVTNGRKATVPLTLIVGAPTPVEVHGHIVDFEHGQPLALEFAGELEVSLWGRGALSPVVIHPVADTFSFAGVVPPYDLEIYVGAESPVRELFLGLSRTDPTVTYFGYALSPPNNVNHIFAIGYSDPDSVGYTAYAYGIDCDSGAKLFGANDVHLNTAVFGPAGSGAVTCDSAQFAYGTGGVLPVSYSTLHSASSSVNLSDGTTTDLNFVADAANNQTVAVSATPPASGMPYIDYRWFPDALRAESYFATEVASVPESLVVPGDAALGTGVCLSAAFVPNPYTPLAGGGTTACRLTQGATAAAFGTLTAPGLPGEPANIVAGHIAFAAVPGFNGYIIDKTNAPIEERIVFINGALTSDALTKHGLELTSDASYTWQSFLLDGIDSVDGLVATDVTLRGLITRQGGYSLSTPQPFNIAD